MGPVGSGKTSIMNIMKFIRPPLQRHIMISTRKISCQFIKEGYGIIEKYSVSSFICASDDWIPKTYCFDDLAVENNLKYYGNECNVMAEIPLSRHDFFISRKMLTHITTNLTSSEIENIYSIRVRSRLRQMCNLVSFGDSKDKRV